MKELSHSRVLLADDEWLLCWSLERHLIRHGLDVVSATSSKEALLRLNAGKFDWLVTDLKLPEMDGFELIEAAKLIQPELKIILMTAHGSSSVEATARKLGAEYIAKPFDLDRIAAIINPLATPPIPISPA